MHHIATTAGCRKIGKTANLNAGNSGEYNPELRKYYAVV